MNLNLNNYQTQSQNLQKELEDHKIAYLQRYSEWLDTARNEQVTPEGDWAVWLILAGRGWGKTLTGAYDACLYGLKYPNSQIAVITPTFGDLRRVAFGGVSGMLSIIPPECLLKGRGQGYNSASAEIRLANGSKIMGFSATEPDRLRGVQFHRAWCDELAAWQYPETYDQLLFGLRLGDNPQVVITTTPKPTKLVKDLVANRNAFITRGTTYDNAENLSPQAVATLKEKYENTRLGRQELLGEVLEDVEGALWSTTMIEECRISKNEKPQLQRIVVAIDPAVTANANSDETGILVVGKTANNRYYVLNDSSGKYSADTWARKAIDLFYDYKADRIVAETNNGGDLVERLIRGIDPQVSYKSVHATRGKIVRAEPISALYEQKRVHHVGIFPELENQMISFTGDTNVSPDRLDALVWGLSELSKSSGNISWRVS